MTILGRVLTDTDYLIIYRVYEKLIALSNKPWVKDIDLDKAERSMRSGVVQARIVADDYVVVYRAGEDWLSTRKVVSILCLMRLYKTTGSLTRLFKELGEAFPEHSISASTDFLHEELLARALERQGFSRTGIGLYKEAS